MGFVSSLINIFFRVKHVDKHSFCLLLNHSS
ncbi:hypothetical protein YPS_3034 [Yersinia pestis Pestoides A]|nr:hypothetical protein YPS_3034 [Yersinia pestis Pestoides A]